MELERLEHRIERALGQTRFRNVRGQGFDASVMRELYAGKRHRDYRLSGAESVSVRESELAALVSAIAPMLARYRASDTGLVGNGLYRLMGSLASPRLPSVEDYARILVLASARIGPRRTAAAFSGWIAGQPIPVWQCFLLKGAINDGRISPRDGLALETLSGNGEEFPRSLYVQLDAGDIKHEQYGRRAMLSLEHEVGPALYSPDAEEKGFPESFPRPEIRNRELSWVSAAGVCRAMSLEINNNVDWFRSWWDYGDIDAFFLNPGHGMSLRETSSGSPQLISDEQLTRCLEIDERLKGFSALDVAISRWRRSKRGGTLEERLVELRVALESALLAGDSGNVAEMQFRIATRGAWLLGETYEERKACFDTLRKAYGLASSVLHGRSLKVKNREEDAGTVSRAQDLCRVAILHMVREGALPNWDEVVLGRGH
ncbi:MAG: hypothetical protein OXU75_10795 [Deltaproteobacteria bacterium]|nr:hypothetical protein [Deltaproteobacteria bacterium]